MDAGDIQFMELISTYACTGEDVESSTSVRSHSFPSSGPLPGAPESRAVVPGSDAARAASKQILAIEPGKAGFTLFKLGEALHVLQDSWSHQGTPEVPSAAGLKCNPGLSWGHAASRGGWASHRADLTWAWPADTVAMAAASYQILTSYPIIDRVARKPAAWEKVQPALAGFASAKTKADKAKWFSAQGFGDVSFLAGTTLPDGKAPFKLEWRGDKLPPLKTALSGQHHIDADLLDFFKRLLRRVGLDRGLRIDGRQLRARCAGCGREQEQQGPVRRPVDGAPEALAPARPRERGRHRPFGGGAQRRATGAARRIDPIA